MALRERTCTEWEEGGQMQPGHHPQGLLVLRLSAGTSVMQVMASDADDPAYGSSARVVYSVLEGEQHFTVDSGTGQCWVQLGVWGGGLGHAGCSLGREASQVKSLVCCL